MIDFKTLIIAAALTAAGGAMAQTTDSMKSDKMAADGMKSDKMAGDHMAASGKKMTKAQQKKHDAMMKKDAMTSGAMATDKIAAPK